MSNLNKTESRVPIAIDLHADTLQRVLDEGVDLGQRSSSGHIDLPRMREGGLNAQFFSLWVHPGAFPKEKAVQRTWQLIKALKDQLTRHPERMELALNAADIERITASGRVAAAMGIEGGHSINGDIKLVEDFFNAGVRYMTLSWSNSNEICGSSGDSGRERGLTEFGRNVVRLMNRLGMMVDISHVSDRAFFEALELSNRPVIASHSNLRKICNHPRNLTDEMMRALAQQGGVCCINFYPVFLDDSYFKHYTDLGTKLAEEAARGGRDFDRIRSASMASIPVVSYKKVVDHIEAAVEIAGIDHVGIGSDYDGIPSVPVGLEDVSKLQIIADELTSRGFDRAAIEKIMGLNVLRVFAASQKENYSTAIW